MVTIDDIARHTKFSRSTVSAVLSGKGERRRIKEATRSIIIEAAKKLGYHRNALAYQMVTGTTNVIGFLCADFGESEFINSILSGVIHESDDNGYYTKMFPYSKGNAENTLKKILEQRPMGIIAFGILQPDFEIISAELKKYNIPLLSLNDISTDHGVFVVTDDTAGVIAAVDHLYMLGHRKIGFFDNRKSIELKEPRVTGFLQAVKRHNLSESKIITEFIDNPDLETLTRVIAERPYSAIVCSTDYHAMQILQASTKAGVSVPEELSVIGFADVFAARFCSPSLTTIKQPFTQWGIIAVRKLLSMVKNKLEAFPTEKCITKIPLKMIIRNSTGPV